MKKIVMVVFIITLSLFANSNYEKGLVEYQKENFQEAARLFKISAETGFALAQNKLGDLYKEGKGVKFNPKKAFFWYEKAAENGNAQAQYNLGTMYQHGEGVQINFMVGMTLFELAAAQGNADAQSMLGFINFSHGNPDNYPIAIKWFKLAAAQGDSRALNDLATMYYYGMGVEADKTKAFKYYKSSAEKNHKKAKQNLFFLCEETPEICK